ncbi:MAG: hypothetical protein ABIB98_00760 [bacterium]
MFRVCPKCNKTIKSSDTLFCYHCGNVLDTLEKETNSNPTKTLPQTENLNIKKEITSKRFGFVKILSFTIFLILILAGGYFGYVKFKNEGNVTEEIINPVDITKDQTFEIDFSDIDIKLSTGTVNEKILSQIAPVGVDSFIVLNNPSSFYDNFVEENSKVDVNDLTGLSVEEIASFLESSFALVMREDSWAFIAKTKNKDFLETKLSEIDIKDLDFEISLVGDFLIITNDINLLSEIENIENAISLSLSKDAFFVETVKNLPSEGVALVFYRNVDKIKPLLKKVVGDGIFDSKGKNGFVAIKSGKGVILQF